MTNYAACNEKCSFVQLVSILSVLMISTICLIKQIVTQCDTNHQGTYCPPLILTFSWDFYISDKNKDTLTRDVWHHGEDEEGVVVEGEVILVGQSDWIEPCLLNIRQCSIDGQKFSSHSHGVQHNKECVSAETLNTISSVLMHQYLFSNPAPWNGFYTSSNVHLMNVFRSPWLSELGELRLELEVLQIEK